MITSLSEVNKFPVVLIGPPRSGSSVVCRQIAKDLNLPFFSDITYSSDKTTLLEFLKFIETTEKYVVKCHIEDLPKYPKVFVDKVYNNESYNCKIIRNNHVEQLASIWLAEIRNTYTYSESTLDKYKNQNVKLFKIQLLRCLKRMNDWNSELENAKISFDKTIVYENYVYDSNFLTGITPKPENYEELKNMCELIIKGNLK